MFQSPRGDEKISAGVEQDFSCRFCAQARSLTFFTAFLLS